AVREKAPCSLTVGLEKASVLVGDKVTIPVKLKRFWPDLTGPIQVTAINPSGQRNQFPIGFNNNQPLTLNSGKDETSAVLDVRNNAPPGVYSVVLKATGTLSYSRDSGTKNKQNVTIAEVSQPITITIVPKNLATVTVSPQTANAKVG